MLLSPEKPVAESTPLFHTAFGGSTRLAVARGPYFHGARDQYEDLCGVDPTVPSPNDWEQFGRHPNLGTFRVYYEGGNASQRAAHIVVDEANPSKKLLRFTLAEPNVTVHHSTGPEHKARVQTELYGNTDLREVYQSVRMRLHPSYALLEKYPSPLSWMTLMEFWNQPFWGDENRYPFRISLNMVKQRPGDDSPLVLSAHAQEKVGEQKFQHIWGAKNTEFTLPYNRWITLDTYYREGDRASGRFYAAVTPEGGERSVLFDVRDFTHHHANPAPAGLTHLNPMKLYTSAKIVNFVRARGGVLGIDWSDYSIWQGRTPE